MFNTSHISKCSPAILAEPCPRSTPLTLDNTQLLRAASRDAQCCRKYLGTVPHTRAYLGTLQENIWTHYTATEQTLELNTTYAADVETSAQNPCRKFLSTHLHIKHISLKCTDNCNMEFQKYELIVRELWQFCNKTRLPACISKSPCPFACL